MRISQPDKSVKGIPCSSLTKTKKVCPNDSTYLEDGKPVCHVHAQGGKFRQNVTIHRVKRIVKRERARAMRDEIQSLHDRQYDRDADAMREAQGLSKPNRRG